LLNLLSYWEGQADWKKEQEKRKRKRNFFLLVMYWYPMAVAAT